MPPQVKALPIHGQGQGFFWDKTGYPTVVLILVPPLVLAPGVSKSQGVEGPQLFFLTFGGSKTRGGG